MNRLAKPLQLFGVKYEGMISSGADLAGLVFSICKESKHPLRNGDIVVLTHTVVAKAEGCKIPLESVVPSNLARAIAEKVNKAPELVEVILQHSKRLIRIQDHHLITQSESGIVCANSGVDQSNVDGGKSVVVVPENPDRVAAKYARRFQKLGVKVGVVITDTLGRPFRIGEVNFAIGSHGLNPLNDLRGKKDLAGRRLHIKMIAIADEIAAAAELVTGSSSEGIIGAVIKGYRYKPSRKGASTLQRPFSQDLFV
jgi:coenzyme F420-0:L-glutamate ligase/coenzyme F420-1:gamma-L-glutamate ligase